MTAQPSSIELDIVFGGYYLEREVDDKYFVMRLLDISNSGVVHVQMFKEKFEALPLIEELKVLTPYVWHVPISLALVFGWVGQTPIGHKPLSDEDMKGYKTYLEMESGWPDEQIDEFIKRIQEYSLDTSFLRLKVTKDKNGVTLGDINDQAGK